MTLLERVALACRRGARRVGFVRDRTRAAATSIEAFLDDRAKALADAAGVPGLAVAVRFAEGHVIRRSVGEAGPGRPMEFDAVFPVCSISKAMTAFCAMSLVQDGVLALDEPVWDRIRSWTLPEARRAGAPLAAFTLRRLLSHSAGFDEVIYHRGPPARTPLARDLLPACDADDRVLHVVAPPGTRFRYSGGGFVVAQLLIEEVTGRRFADVVHERILEPLGLRSSGYDLTPDLLARHVTGRAGDGAPLAPTTTPAPSAAGLFSTAEDVVTLWSALAPGVRGEAAGRGVLTPRTCEEILARQVDHPHGGGWGVGVQLKFQAGDVRYQHGGRDAGCFCYVQGFARRGAVVAVLSNADAGGECVLAVCREVRHLLHRYL